MRHIHLVFLTAVCLALPVRAQTTFPAGSIIIPMQASYQDACEMVSAYGLVYQALRANASVGGGQKVTVHWAIRTTKSSPNRCVPTNQDSPPITSGVTPSWDNPAWNDGCDFRVVNTAGVPVTLVNNALPDPANDTNVVTKELLTDPIGAALASPGYNSRTISFANQPTDVTSVGYMGGALIISAADAPVFLQMVSGSKTFTDANGLTVDFSPFRNTSVACNVVLSNVWGPTQAVFTDSGSGSPGTPGFANAYALRHHVNLHRAKVAFSASDTIRMNAPPPKIAVLQTIAGQYDSNEFANPPATGIKGVALPNYLRSAGLSYPGAGGCPTNGAGKSSPLCPSPVASGQIYDNIDVMDLGNSAVFSSNSYKILWVPHWEATPFSTCNATCIQNALKGIATFTQATTGMLAECASIGALEGADVLPGFTPALGGPTFKVAASVPATQSATCVQNLTGTACASPPTTTGYGLIHDTAAVLQQLPNCTDPNAAANSPCAHFSSPGQAYGQIGDFRFFTWYGSVTNYLPTSAGPQASPPGIYPGAKTMYLTSSLPLISQVPSLNPATFGTPAGARAQDGADSLTFIQKDNNISEAQIIYLGGHNLSSDVAGTRIVLNTLLALGLQPDYAETNFAGPTLYQNNLYVPTYEKVTTAGAPPQWHAFDPSAGWNWIFPYHTGIVRAHPVTGTGALAVGTNGYASSVTTDASLRPYSTPDPTSSTDATRVDKLHPKVAPLNPATRNLFTYLGGAISTTGAAASMPAGAAQTGWVPIDVDSPSLNVTSPSCTHNLHIGKVGPVGAPTNKPGPYAGMLAPGADPLVCDLEEALGVAITQTDLGTDFGASEQTAIATKLKTTAAINNTKQVLQMVRGFCYANDLTGAPLATPTNDDCYLNKQASVPLGGPNYLVKNGAFMGAFVHAQMAVIPQSMFIADLPAGKHRPTVAYIGGLDGQLHAFYVPSDGNDTGYTGPAQAVSDLNPTSSPVFHTNWLSGAFAAPAPMTELWSFIPPGQLPFLRNNAARVDASPAVTDVFADFSGSGLPSWHTVLVASAGGQNRELFALDVTNPLKPVLLWDMESSFDSTALAYAVASLADDDTGFKPPLGQAVKWQNSCRKADQTAGKCTPTTFVTPPPSSAMTGPFNYVRLGASQTISIAPTRRNNVPVFVAYIASNEPGGNGLDIFAADIVTGQKIWEFDNPYDPSNRDATGVMAQGVGNNPPPGVSLFSSQNNAMIDTAFVGDDEGSLWKIDAAYGNNLSSYSPTTGCCNYSLSQAFGVATVANGGSPPGPQPISTLSTIFQVPMTLSGTGNPLLAYQGQTLLAYGTAGTDTVSAITPDVPGYLHLLPLGAAYQYSPTNPAPVTVDVSKVGVGQEVPSYPFKIAVGRLFGAIVATGQGLFYATTSGNITDIDKRGTLGGATYATYFNTPTTQTSLASGVGGAGGTPAIAKDASGNVLVITVTDQTINVSAPGTSGANLAGPGVNGTGRNPTSLIGWILKASGRAY